MGCGVLIAARLQELLALTAHHRQPGQILGGQTQVRAWSPAALMTPLNINLDSCCLLFSLLLRFISAEWLPGLSVLLLLEPTVALANPLCLTLSSVWFEVALAEEGTSDGRKNPFFSKPLLLGFTFSNAGNRSEKRRGGKLPKAFL